MSLADSINSKNRFVGSFCYSKNGIEAGTLEPRYLVFSEAVGIPTSVSGSHRECRSCKRGRYAPPVHLIKLTAT
jgi:hypothetical protein